jgi:GTP-binding protein HflX
MGEHTVSLVGYTNAGKSTLMNALTGAGVGVEDKLFSTLETRTRQWRLKEWGKVLLSDTVGFIRDLPHHLVASFKATLEETMQAKLLIHVVDASSPQVEDQIDAVKKVLSELGCEKKTTLLVLNKVDKIADESILHVLQARHPSAVCISAATRQGIDQLRDSVISALSSEFLMLKIEAYSGNGNCSLILHRMRKSSDKNLLMIKPYSFALCLSIFCTNWKAPMLRLQRWMKSVRKKSRLL